MSDKANFAKVNKINVAIASLRNKLKQANDVNVLTIIASDIIKLEQEILFQRTAGYKKLEEEKKEKEDRRNSIQRSLQQVENDIKNIDVRIDLKINGYKKNLQDKIDLINEEYTSALDTIQELDD
jgi:septal ring factor EnvC (AmiA/AmiB activator)